MLIEESKCKRLEQYENIFSHVISYENFEEVHKDFDKLLAHYSMRNRKKLNALFVEILQNVLRYGLNIPRIKSVFYLLKDRNEKKYVFVTGNAIEKAQKQKLTRTIDLINTLSNETIDKLYFHLLESNFFTEGGGAGVGLFDMKRKSDYSKIDYHIKDYENFAYFYMILEYPLH